jgi:eukaryotic-like serine/threonine-protein kinase
MIASFLKPAGRVGDLRERLSIVLAAKYELLSQIGSGGMSTVYLARHRAHNGLFAVKVLHPHLAREAEILASFYREAIYAARLAAHPHIANVFDIGEADGLHYLIMAWIRGEDLDRVLARHGRFPVPEAVRCAAQINDALRYAHRNDVLHSDLTPGNVRLNEFGSCIVLDFGLARSRSASNAALFRKVRIGTPYYMSPECIRGEGADPRSDLYSLGVILFELITGKRPFEGATCADVEQGHLFRSLTIPLELTREYPRVAELLQTLLQKSKANRPQSADHLHALLLQSGIPPSAEWILPHLPEIEPLRRVRKRLLDQHEDESA